ncbi:MAG: hypothetical protein WC934_12530 [Acidithiobacillus sp.]|jgi:hypothetical protein|uniref:hypothetical protein n=1 Tax=Acidithiobacillus sp. TaxID=1872118 RepID=UPI00355F919C
MFIESRHYKIEELNRIYPEKLEVKYKGILMVAGNKLANVMIDSFCKVGFNYRVYNKNWEYAGMGGYVPNLGQWYELKDLKETVYKDSNICYNNINKSNIKTNQTEVRKMKLIMTKEFESKTSEEMTIIINLKGTENITKVNEMVDFMNASTEHEMDAKFNGITEREEDGTCFTRIVFSREYYSEFNKLYKDFKKKYLN